MYSRCEPKSPNLRLEKNRAPWASPHLGFVLRRTGVSVGLYMDVHVLAAVTPGLLLRETWNILDPLSWTVQPRLNDSELLDWGRGELNRGSWVSQDQDLLAEQLYAINYQLRKGAWPRKTNLRGFTLLNYLSRRCRGEGRINSPSTQPLPQAADRLSFRRSDRSRCLPRRSLSAGRVKPVLFRLRQ